MHAPWNEVAMTITISLRPEAEERLRKRAEEAGLAPDALARQLLEQALTGEHVAPPGRPRSELDEILAPFRKQVADSGMTDEELKDLFTQARDELRREKRSRRAQS
jgi:hypothetical protein